MFGPEGRPQHCCAWLGIASSFPECASPVVPEEVKTNLPQLLYTVNCQVLTKVLNHQLHVMMELYFASFLLWCFAALFSLLENLICKIFAIFHFCLYFLIQVKGRTMILEKQSSW
jgi:hypothetical protein